MSLTININIPENLVCEPPAGGSLKPAPPKPADAEPDMMPLPGPAVSMLLFALTRATTDPGNKVFMTPDQEAILRTNDKLYNMSQGSPPTTVNGIDGFKAFIAQADPKYLQTLKDAQDLYAAFMTYIKKQDYWDETCKTKYSQLANMAQIDWSSME
jgi:hypothetical protein